MGEVFGELFVQRGQVRATVASRQATSAAHIVDAQAELPLPPAAASAPVQAAHTETQSGLTDQLGTFFAADGEKLELIDNRLKASNQSDYVRRLTFVFLYAHESADRPSASEEEIKVVLRENKVWDRAGNAAKWLKKRIGIAETGENRLKLTATGREEAKKTLAEAIDANVQDTWNPDKQASKGRATRGAKKS